MLIIGSGIAGLSLALKLAEDRKVLIITKADAIESNTRYAQGGIASVISTKDNFDSHIADTMEAGAFLNDEKVVERVVEAGPHVIDTLVSLGVRFSKPTKDDINPEGPFALGREGGHSERRILHAKDITGFEIENKLLKKALRHPRIKILEHHMAIDLIGDRHLKRPKNEDRCYGVYALNRKTKTIVTIQSGVTVLASGGAGKTYLYTSNPDVASGDGIAMAYRIGCVISNLEFVQFHPTCLHHPKAKSFLISEALRGEGGKLLLQNHEPFMKNYHPKAELAPRDIVARAIDYELKKRGDRHVYLDMTHKSKKYLQQRFPTIEKTCRQYGIDISKEPIPVVPAAHYFCGGVKVDHRGRTSIENLYAIGEVSCTGLHGANRLASNSLLEGVAFAEFVAADVRQNKNGTKLLDHTVRNWDKGKATNADELVVVMHNWDEIRRMMWNYVGIVRSNKRLKRAERRIKVLLEEVKEYYWDFIPTDDILELRNICRVADLTIRCALNRKESIGLHFNIDHPKQAKNSKRHNTIRKTL